MAENHFLTDDERLLVGQRIKELRTKNEMTQNDLGINFAKFLGRDKKFRYSTICGWENGNVPRQKTLYLLADFFNIEPSYFFLEEASMTQSVLSGHFVPVKKVKEQLRMYDGLPVWCSFKEESNVSLCGKWGMVDVQAGVIIFSSRNYVSFENINFDIYRQPVQFSYALESNGTPLSLSILKKKKKVWIEPLNGDFETRQHSKGFGQYNKTLNIVALDNGLNYSLDSYGVAFLAFEDPCDYEKEEPILNIEELN